MKLEFIELHAFFLNQNLLELKLYEAYNCFFYCFLFYVIKWFFTRKITVKVQ